METIDFNQVIKDNISVVGELIVDRREKYTLEPNVEVQITERTGLYYLSYLDTNSLLITTNYSSFQSVGNSNGLSFRVAERKLYATNTGTKSIQLNVKKLATNY